AELIAVTQGHPPFGGPKCREASVSPLTFAYHRCPQFPQISLIGRRILRVLRTSALACDPFSILIKVARIDAPKSIPPCLSLFRPRIVNQPPEFVTSVFDQGSFRILGSSNRFCDGFNIVAPSSRGNFPVNDDFTFSISVDMLILGVASY